MIGRRLRLLRLVLLLFTLVGFATLIGIESARADEITDWNVIVIDVLALGGQNPVQMTRGLALDGFGTPGQRAKGRERVEGAYAAALSNLLQGEQIGRQAFT